MSVHGDVIVGRVQKESAYNFCDTLLGTVGHSCKTLRRTALLTALSFNYLRTRDIPTNQGVGSSNLSGRAKIKDLPRFFLGPVS